MGCHSRFLQAVDFFRERKSGNWWVCFLPGHRTFSRIALMTAAPSISPDGSPATMKMCKWCLPSSWWSGWPICRANGFLALITAKKCAHLETCCMKAMEFIVVQHDIIIQSWKRSRSRSDHLAWKKDHEIEHVYRDLDSDSASSIFLLLYFEPQCFEAGHAQWRHANAA